MDKKSVLTRVTDMCDELEARQINSKMKGLLNVVNINLERHEEEKSVYMKNQEYFIAKITEEKIEETLILRTVLLSLCNEIDEVIAENKEYFEDIKIALSDESLTTESDNA